MDLEYHFIRVVSHNFDIISFIANMDDKRERLMKRKLSKAVKPVSVAVIASVAAGILAGCSSLEYPKEATFKSPSGDKKVVVKQDWVCRPDVYYGKECIFEYDRQGFMEEVVWEVEWVSEDEIILYLASPRNKKYADERYTIELPD